MTVGGSDLFWDELLELVECGEVVPVVGPDLLDVRFEGREVRLHRILATRLAEALDVSGADLPPGSELNEVACRYLAQGKKWQRLYAALKRVMPSEDEIPVPPPLVQLAEILPFRLFVTTSFDPLLERAVRQARPGPGPRSLVYTPSSREDLPSALESLDRPTVFYLFGQISATPSYAVTQEDVLEFVHALQSRELQPEILFDELEHKSLLILGSGLSDWLARFFLRTVKSQPLRTRRESTDFVADDRIRDDADLVIFLKHFSSGTEIFTEGGVVEFIAELHRRWKLREPETFDTEELRRATQPAHAKDGAVFLSYAHEDLEAAEALCEALEAAGVEVFFDKKDLQGGDEYTPKLERAIRRASLFIPLISRHSLQDRSYFIREWNYALDQSLEVRGTFIMPLAVDDTSQDEEAFPEKFRSLHWERASEGIPSSAFVDKVKAEFRRFQKMQT